MYLCCTNPKSAKIWLNDSTLKGLSVKLSNHPRINEIPIQRFVEGWPKGQNGPEAFVTIPKPKKSAKTATPVNHGLSLRLRIFYDKAHITELLLNGHPVNPSETDGYTTWIARGYLYIQINIPPEKAKDEDLFIVTCRYDPGVIRTHWQGWRNIVENYLEEKRS